MMKKLWDLIFGIDEERSIWVEEDELGKEKAIQHHRKQYFVTIPSQIDKHIIIRLKGLGKKRRDKVGTLYLHVWVNRGEDIYENLWLSESSAHIGTDKTLAVNGRLTTLVIPPKSHNGLTIRIKDHGAEAMYTRIAPIPRKRGNLFIKLHVFPDTITPNYGTFDSLSTDNMALEGWVYRRFDEILQKMGKEPFTHAEVGAEKIADIYNKRGWLGIFDELAKQLRLDQSKIEITQSSSLPRPGSCEQIPLTTNNKFVGFKYKIAIDANLLDNPFLTAAIVAHELCHVVHTENLDETTIKTGQINRDEKNTLDVEHTVDLLVFMFRVGEFQLRVARDKGRTLGYFNQEIFERMQVIVSKKLALL